MRPAAARHLATALVATALAAAIGAAAPAAAAPTPPAVDAEAFIVVDRASGTTIAGEDVRERRPIASTTKLMTALLTLERADPRELLTASSYEPEPIESQIGLEDGERLAVRDLLVALLLESANDAAATLAARLDSSTRAFVADMNARAEELGLDDTSYANPIGFDAARNYSTAADLARLARVLLRDDRFSHIVGQPRLELHSGDLPRVVYNRNDLVGEVPFVDGVKTGNTLGAGHVLVGSATREDAGVVSVVLGAPSEAVRDDASESLLRYGLDQFRERRVLRPSEPLADVAAAGVEQPVPVAAERGLTLTLLRGQPVETRVDAPAQLEGPLPAGERVGSVAVRSAGEEVRRVPLVTASAVPEPQDLVSRVASTLGERPIQAAAVAAAVAALLAAATALGIRSRRRRRSAANATGEQPT